MKHKLLSILLSLSLVISLLPTVALAAEGTTEVKFTPQGGSEVAYMKAEDANGNITLYFDSEKEATNYATASYELNGKIVTFKGATLRSVNNLMRAYWEVCKNTTGCDYNPDMLPANESGTLTWTIYGKVEQGEYLNSGALILPALSGGYIYNSSGYQWKKIAVNAGTENATIVSNSNFSDDYGYISAGKESTTITGIKIDGSTYAKPANGSNLIFENCTIAGMIRTPNGNGKLKVTGCTFVGDTDTENSNKKNEYVIFSQAGGELEFTNNTVSSDVYTRGLNVGGSTNLETKINGNNIGAVSAGYSAIQLSGSVTKAQITSNQIAVNGGNAFTLHSSLAAGSEVGVSNNTITGTGYLFYDETDTTEVDITYTGNDVPDTINTTEGIKGTDVKENSSSVSVAVHPVATINGKGYATLADALDAVKDGETITLLKDTKLEDAQYTIDKSVTINGSGKISCTVKTGETTCAFVVENNGSLTLDGVELDIQGTKNSDTKKNNDGTGIDVQFGGKLVLKNGAVLTLHDLNRGTIFSEPTGSPEIPGQVVIDNSTFNSTNIDGNASNGGNWTVTNGSVNINNCGSYGLSVNSLTTEQSTVNVSGTGYSAICGKELQFKDGSNVLINGAGTELPYNSPYSDAKSPIQTNKNGSLVVDSGATVTVQNCVDKNGKANNTIYLPKNTTYTNNGTVNATIITDAAPEGSCVVTLVSDGVTIGVQTVSKDSKFALPAAPEKNNYTFKGWSDGSATHKAGDVVTITENTTFTALWSYNGSSSGGGSSSSSRRYDVSAPSVKHGDVTVSPKNASKGDTVTITVKPDRGYELDTLTVKDASGSKIKVKDKGDGKFTFTMPASKVTISAEFAEIETLDFADVSTDAYYYEAVKWAAKKGITGGIGNGLFGPNQPCTRAQIVTFLWRAAGSPELKSMSSFSDVSADSYYAKAVAWAVENGITTGTGDGKFSPDATCTRAQSVTFLFRAIGKLVDSKAEFSDVLTDSYYANAVAWAVENGVTNGIGNGLFGPDNSCTRAQIVTFLYRAYQGK